MQRLRCGKAARSFFGGRCRWGRPVLSRLLLRHTSSFLERETSWISRAIQVDSPTTVPGLAQFQRDSEWLCPAGQSAGYPQRLRHCVLDGVPSFSPLANDDGVQRITRSDRATPYLRFSRGVPGCFCTCRRERLLSKERYADAGARSSCPLVCRQSPAWPANETARGECCTRVTNQRTNVMRASSSLRDEGESATR